MADLKLKILMEAVDRITAPFKAIKRSATGLRSAVGQTADKLRALEASSQQMERFRALKMATKANGDALAAAQARTTALAAAMQGAETVTKAMRREFAQATAATAKLKEVQERNAQELQRLRASLRAAGVDTAHFGAEQRRLKAEIASTTAEAEHQAAALARVAARAKAMGNARSRMERTQNSAGSMAGSGAAGLAMGGTALVATATVANVGIEFEAMMSKVGALSKVDKTSEAFQKLEKQAFDLGATTSFSASQAAEAMANLAMAGFDAEKILGVMPSMLNLAKAGSTELGTTASITANIMAGFGLQASQMGDVGDVLVATFTNSNTNLEMLGETMKYVAPIAKAAGYSLGDVSVLAGLLGNVGIQGSDAGTAMRASLIRLAAPPKEAEKALEALGVTTKDVSGNLRPMAAVLGDIAEKTKAMGNAQKIESFSKIFGVEAAAAITELVDKAGSQGIADFTKVIKGAQGLNDRISAQMADNAKGDLDNLSSAAEGVAIILTKLNTQPLRDLAQWAAVVVTNIGDWMLANPRLTATLTQIAVVVAALVAAGGALALTIAGILGPFAILRFAATAVGLQLPALASGFLAVGRALVMGVVPAVWSLTTALLANPIGVVIAAIAAAAAVLIIGWEPIAGFFTDLWGQVSGACAGAWAGIEAMLGFSPLAVIAPVWTLITDFFGSLWGQVTSTFTDVWSRVEAALGFSPLAAITTAWMPIADFLAGLWERLPAFATAAWDAIQTVLAFSPIGLVITHWEPIASFFAALWQRLPAFAAAAWSAIQTVLGFSPIGLVITHWEPIASFFAALWERLPAFVAAAWSAIQTVLAFSPIGLIITNWIPLVDFFTGLWGQVTGVFAGVWTGIEAALAFSPLGIVAAAWTPVADFFAALWDGIFAKFSAIWSGITEKIASLRGALDWAGGAWDSLFGGGEKKPGAPSLPTAPTLPTAGVPAAKPVAVIPTPGTAGAAASPPAPPPPPPPPAPIVNQTISIVVNAPPGLNADDVAREVRRQLEQHAAKLRSAAASAMYDH